jgi:hypothetical protein
VPLAADDFVSPVGPLTPTLFPGEDVSALATMWLADAETRSESESAQREWVLHRAYAYAADLMHAGLASDTKGPVSASRSDAQFHYFARKALAHKYAFLALTGVRGVW